MVSAQPGKGYVMQDQFDILKNKLDQLDRKIGLIMQKLDIKDVKSAVPEPHSAKRAAKKT